MKSYKKSYMIKTFGHNLAHVLFISLDHNGNISTYRFKSTCFKFTGLNRIWKGSHLSAEGLLADCVCLNKN